MPGKLRGLGLPLTLWTTERCLVAQAPANGEFALSPSLESYRKYALTHEGDVARGASLFRDEQKLACSKCHSVDGRAGQAGPDLFAVGDKFGRRDLVDAVLTPSAVISPGYSTVIVETKSGEEVQGILKQVDQDLFHQYTIQEHQRQVWMEIGTYLMSVQPTLQTCQCRPYDLFERVPFFLQLDCA